MQNISFSHHNHNFDTMITNFLKQEIKHKESFNYIQHACTNPSLTSTQLNWIITSVTTDGVQLNNVSSFQLS
jgi:hypothetical protein